MTDPQQPQINAVKQAELAGIDSRLESARANAQRQSRWRGIFVSLALLCLVAPIIDLFGSGDISDWITVPLGALAAILLVAPQWIGGMENQAEIEKLESLKRWHLTLLSNQGGETYFDRLVKINVDNLAEYYSLVKGHTKQSFELSAVVASIGFGLIVAGVTAQFLGNVASDSAYVTTAAGTIVETIAGLFFYLYNKTVRQLKEYHDGLLDVQNILLSFKLIDGAKDEATRAGMTSKMIEFLATRRAAPRGA